MNFALELKNILLAPFTPTPLINVDHSFQHYGHFVSGQHCAGEGGMSYLRLGYLKIHQKWSCLISFATDCTVAQNYRDWKYCMKSMLYANFCIYDASKSSSWKWCVQQMQNAGLSLDTNYAYGKWSWKARKYCERKACIICEQQTFYLAESFMNPVVKVVLTCVIRFSISFRWWPNFCTQICPPLVGSVHISWKASKTAESTVYTLTINCECQVCYWVCVPVQFNSNWVARVVQALPWENRTKY